MLATESTLDYPILALNALEWNRLAGNGVTVLALSLAGNQNLPYHTQKFWVSISA